MRASPRLIGAAKNIACKLNPICKQSETTILADLVPCLNPYILWYLKPHCEPLHFPIKEKKSLKMNSSYNIKIISKTLNNQCNVSILSCAAELKPGLCSKLNSWAQVKTKRCSVFTKC